jgi:hypothetical protein
MVNDRRVRVSDAIRSKATSTKNFMYKATGREGAALKVVDGAEPQIPVRALGRLAGNATLFAIREPILARQAAAQSRRGERLKRVAMQHDGVRGIALSKIGRVVNIFPSYKITYDRDVLKSALGQAYPTVAHEKLTFGIDIPEGVDTLAGPLTPELAAVAVHAGFLALGISPEERDKIMTTTIDVKVDNDGLAALIDSGRVDQAAVDQAGEVTEGWTVRVDELSEQIATRLQAGTA